MQLSPSISPSKLYIGKDIHKRSYHVTLHTDVSEHKSMSIPANPQVLIDYVQKYFPHYDVSLTYEAGCCGFSSAREYLNMGWQVSIVNPADVPTGHKQSFQKTDKIDSRNLCRQLKMGNLKAIYIPTEAQEQFRALVRHRISLAKDLRRAKSKIKSALLFHGINIPEAYDNNNWTHAFRQWLKNIEWSNPCGKLMLEYKLQDFEYVYAQYKQVSNDIRAYAKQTYPKEYELLRSIPGIGGFIAAAILAEVGDFSRFSNETEFSSFVGVVPGIYHSGSSEKTLGVTPRANHVLRPLLIEAVWVAVRKDAEIQQYYKKHLGANPKTIVVKIAHKMVRRILAIIKSGKPYEVNHQLQLDKDLKLPHDLEESNTKEEEQDELP